MKIVDLEKRAQEIKEMLKPWAGMTISEAKTKGWGEVQDHLQAELWWLGYEINKFRCCECGEVMRLYVEHEDERSVCGTLVCPNCGAEEIFTDASRDYD